MARVQIQDVGPPVKNHTCDRAVVLTVIWNAEAVDALICTVAGMEHDAPVGAPVQVSDAVPLVPWPPMEREYVALEPADTLADAEPPEATPSPMSGVPPVPASVTV